MKKMVVIFITTYKRQNSLQLLLNDILREKNNFNFKLVVCIDDYNSNYDEVIKFITQNFAFSIILKNEIHFGKANYWQIINQGFEEIKKLEFDYVFQLHDDIRLTDNYFANCIEYFELIEKFDKKFICLNSWTDYSRRFVRQWTNVYPIAKNYNNKDVVKMGWIDMIYVAKRKFFEVLNWKINEPLQLFLNENKSSGVGADISTRIINKGYFFYQVKHSLAIHLNHESVMHPNLRTGTPLISNHNMDKRIFSLASIPSREKSLHETIKSIYAQADEIHVFLNDYEKVPSFLNDNKITTYMSQDFQDLGDAGKFFAVDNAKGWFFSCDDDIIYPENYADTMIMWAEIYKQKAVVTLHGRILHNRKSTSYYHDYLQAFSCLNDVNENVEIHVPGTGVTMFHTDTLKVSISDFECKNMGDIWLAKLCQEQNVPVMCLAHKKGFIKETAVYDKNHSIYAHLHRSDKVQTEVINKINWKFMSLHHEIAIVEYEKIKSIFFTVSPQDLIFNVLKKGNFYELKLLEKIKSLNLSGTFVDVGANIGNHSVFFGKHCNSTQVISIEMNSEIFKVLEGNLVNNLMNKSISYNCGIADKKGFAETSPIMETNVGMTKIVDFDKGSIKMNTLDNLLKDTKNICLVKLDIEGCEVKALNGMKNIIKKHSPVICVELQDKEIFDEFNAIISTLGYTTDKVNYAGTPTYIFMKNTNQK